MGEGQSEGEHDSRSLTQTAIAGVQPPLNSYAKWQRAALGGYVATGVLGTAALLIVSAGSVAAQERPAPGNFDPQQMRQRMLDRMRDQFEVKDDAEWKAISERIDKVMQARRSAGGLGGPGGFGFAGGRGGPGGPGGQQGPGGPGGPPPQGDEGRPEGLGPQGGPPGALGQGQGSPPATGVMRSPPDGPGGMGGPNREATPELEALRKAIQNEAPASEIKSKLAAFRAARQKKEAELEKAQNELRQVLSARQEAVAVTLGLLK